jgi:hypothetical protein
LNASGLVLINNGGDPLQVQAGVKSFMFSQNVAYGSGYAVTVQTQPTGETCNVSNGSGTMVAAVNNVAVTCAGASYTVGGSVSGLLTGTSLVLANGTDTLTVSANTMFMMPKSVVSGTIYDVTVQTPPSGETCTVTNGTNTMPAANVTNVQVSCTAQAYTVGGTITGLNLGGLTPNTQLVLANRTANGTETLTVPFGAPPSFTFTNKVAVNSSYDVVVQSQPSLLSLLGLVVQLTCSVSSGSGNMGTSNVTNVVVTCGL